MNRQIFNKQIIRLAPYLAYALVIFLVFGKALFPRAGELIFGDDIHRSYYFFSQYLFNSLKQGFIPWWNPYLFSGTPFLANPITNAFYPVNWFFYFLPANLVYVWSFALHLFLAMAGTYVLISNIKYQKSNINSEKLKIEKDLIKFNHAAWGAGLIFGLSSFFSSRIYAGHTDVIAAASYLPLTFYLIWQAIEKHERKRIILAGLVFGLQLLAGYQSMSLFTLEAVGIFTVLFALKNRSWQPILKLSIVVAIALGISAVAIIPIQQFVSLSIRTFAKPYSWNSYGSLETRELIQLVNAFILGDQLSYKGAPPNYWEHAIFIGRIGITLVFLGLASLIINKKRKLLVLSFLLITIFGLWMSLGSNAFFDLNKLLAQVFPFYRFLRIPSRHILLVIFGLSILAGTGLTLVKNKLFLKLLIIAITIEMVFYSRHFIVVKQAPEVKHDQSLLNILKNDSSLYRVLPNFGVWVAPRDALDFDSAMTYKWFSATGYDSTLLRNYYEFIDALNGSETPSILDHDVQVPYLNIFAKNFGYLNVKYLLVPDFADPLEGISTDQFKLIREDSNQRHRLYENKQFLPRFYLVSQVKLLDNREEIAAMIRQGNVDLAKTMLLTKNQINKLQLANNCQSGQNPKEVEVISYKPNRIELKIDASCDSFLSTSEVYYPGWTATVDRVKTKVFESNLAFRSVYISKGKHLLVFKFIPVYLFIGLAVSLFFIIICVYSYLKKS